MTASPIEVSCEFTFEAAHWLPHVPPEHKCRRMHGHSYKLAVTITGPVRDDGMVIDYADIKNAVNPVIAALDHTTLNDSYHLNPTCENLCTALWADITNQLPGLSAITVRETDHAYCTYRGPA